jgi:hypothetical protein
MFVTPDQYFHMDDDERKPVAQDAAVRLAPVIGGQLKWRDDGDELHVTGYFNGRPTRLKIWVTFATMYIELKATRSLDTGASFYIHIDPKAAQHAGESMSRDEWDDSDRSEQRLFLAPSVYFEGDPSELGQLNGLMQRLPQPAQAALVQTLAQWQSGHFMVSGDTLSLYCPAWVALGPQSAQYVAYYLNLLFSLSNDMDVAWRGLGG